MNQRQIEKCLLKNADFKLISTAAATITTTTNAATKLQAGEKPFRRKPLEGRAILSLDLAVVLT